jgi:phage shock protein PspC (stress-responsive transcriptional regulator)
LYRVTKTKRIAGVCAGLGEYFNIDPTLIRIAFLLVTIFFGFGILAYSICWVAMPTEKELRDKDGNI